MEIRTVETTDIQEVAQVHIASWQSAFRGVLSDKVLDQLKLEDFMEQWRSNLQQEYRENLLATTDDGQVVGFISFGPERTQEAQAQSSMGELYGLYIHPEHWGHGVGKELLAKALEQLKQKSFREVVLWTMQKNAMARAFYAKHGFSLDGSVKESQYAEERFWEVRFRIVF